MLSSEAAACTCARGIYADVFDNETVHQSIWNCIKGNGCASWPTETGITMEGVRCGLAPCPFLLPPGPQ